MKDNFRKSKSKINEIFSVINFDYAWIFYNGIEMSQKGGNFKPSLKQMYSDGTTSRLVLKGSNKEC